MFFLILLEKLSELGVKPAFEISWVYSIVYLSRRILSDIITVHEFNILTTHVYTFYNGWNFQTFWSLWFYLPCCTCGRNLPSKSPQVLFVFVFRSQRYILPSFSQTQLVPSSRWVRVHIFGTRNYLMRFLRVN